MTNQKAAEATQIALVGMGKDISQIQKDVSGLVVKVEEIRNARYVTQNEMAVAIQMSEKKQAEDLSEIKLDVSSIKKALWGIALTVLLTVLGAVLKLVLKV